MPKSPDQLGSQEGGERNRRFENMVGSLVRESSSLPEKQISQDEKLDVIKAIESKELSLYVGDRPDDRTMDAINCLTAIYDELGKDQPDQEFLNETAEHLKEYL